MPRLAHLFAAALAACSLNVCAQTGAPLPTPADPAAPVMPPPSRPKVCARPVYPREAIRNEWTGVSTLSFLIGVDGQVKDSRVVKSSGHDILDEAARESLSKCQFKPARQDGKPTEAWVNVQYVWTIQ